MKVLGEGMNATPKRIIVSATIVAALLAGSATVAAFAITSPDSAIAEAVPSTSPSPVETSNKVTPSAIPSPSAVPTVAPIEATPPAADVPSTDSGSSGGSNVPPAAPYVEPAPAYVPPAPVEWETIRTEVCETKNFVDLATGIEDPGNTLTTCRTEITTRPKQ
jgi:hypothetical protein